MTLRLGLGPVFAYEWLRASRRWTMYACRAGFVGVLLGGLALVWLVESQRRGPSTMQAQADLAQMYLGIIECVASVTVLLAAPAATAGVICQERAHGTLLDVLANDLSSAEVVLGKLAARLLPVLATIATALPVLAITTTGRRVSSMEFAHPLPSVAHVLHSRCRLSRAHRRSNRSAHRTCP